MNYRTLLVVLSILFAHVSYGQFTIAPGGPTDVCATPVTINVVNPQPGYTYNWYVTSYACSPSSGTPQGPYTFGNSMQAYGTGEFVCYGTGPGGQVEISNPVTVRILPGGIGSASLPRPYPSSQANCLNSVPLCVPSVFYSAFPGTAIQWYKDNTPLTGEVNADYNATTNGYYKYSITSSCTTAFSDSVLVNIPPATPVITTSQPSPACSGSIITYSVTNSVPGIYYGWDISVDGGSYTLLGVGTTINYTVPSASYVTMRARIIGTACTQESNEVLLQIENLSFSMTPTGTISICQDDPLSLTASASVAVTYQWKKNGTLISGATQSTYDVISSGSYTVTATAACGSATSAASNVTVKPLPVATINANGPLTFCAGSSLQLQAGFSSSYTYQWKKYGNSIPGATSYTYNATTAGVYKVTVTNNQGCSKNSPNISISTLPLPTSAITASGATTFCAGNAVSLSANTGTGLSYQWKSYNNPITGATGAVYNASTSGQYKVTVTDSNGCSKNSNKITVSVLKTPKANIIANGPTAFCPGDSVVLKANQDPGFTYQWKKGSVIIPGANNFEYTATTTGYYRVMITNANGCSKNSNTIYVSVVCRVGDEPEVNTAPEMPISAYPNPSSTNFTVEGDWDESDQTDLFVYDISGKTVSCSIRKENTNKYIIEELPVGIFLLRVVSTNEIRTVKLIKTE